MIHEMRLNNEPFNKIKEGTKTVELRLLDEKRKTLRVGDKIIFTNRTNNEKIDVLVTNLFKADSFAPIYEKYSKENSGCAPVPVYCCRLFRLFRRCKNDRG